MNCRRALAAGLVGTDAHEPPYLSEPVPVQPEPIVHMRILTAVGTMGIEPPAPTETSEPNIKASNTDFCTPALIDQSPQTPEAHVETVADSITLVQCKQPTMASQGPYL
ncbi:uncharacterized protein MELLADRAFT_113995 [Melampsora larici-populina 98AG31]|uniref:Uncharacterized protein n=1 Tax=Melampsora larici-populina (strain 98AG31 / pathotype 3-4-7) TaxID=747676 RepID=F4SBS5_MELLP|nr:uncharacterized protein MELLADRAFT_113995 [Melampsora larici-populina 98AG31]EGF97880.1 hypothetical protein MELLADRAFT_113995 [Melampsora larici-populina 98AG31]